MKILGIDPGPEQSASVLWDTEEKRILGHSQAENGLFKVGIKIAWHEGEFEICAIEDVSYYGKVLNRSTFDTLKMIGRLLEICDPYTALVEFPSIAYHFCNSRRGVKTSQINKVLEDKYGGKGTKKNPGPLYGIKEHEWSALSVALYYAETLPDCHKQVAP